MTSWMSDVAMGGVARASRVSFFKRPLLKLFFQKTKLFFQQTSLFKNLFFQKPLFTQENKKFRRPTTVVYMCTHTHTQPDRLCGCTFRGFCAVVCVEVSVEICET